MRDAHLLFASERTRIEIATALVTAAVERDMRASEDRVGLFDESLPPAEKSDGDGNRKASLCDRKARVRSRRG